VRPDDIPARPVLLGVVAENLAAAAGDQPLHPGGKHVRHRDFDGLLVVSASEDRQLERAMARDGVTRAETLARLRAQLPLEAKRQAATVIIDDKVHLTANKKPSTRTNDAAACRWTLANASWVMRSSVR